ncbi:MAG TPA: hypothetical protein VIZ43_25265 [Trebonia sp.]
MSSAILYLAIVAIWACVLIPRWLRRDSARGTSVPAEPPAVAEPDAEAADDGALDDADQGQAEPVRARQRVVEPLTMEEARRRMLAARRRLLLMLIGLEIAAIALAVVGLAAVWVVVPPSVMLIGYLLLLREAAHADTEQAQYEADAVARARERDRGESEQAQRVTPVEGTPTEGIAEAAAALAAKFAAAPVPADYEDSGRDFAPGLAGKYTTSNVGNESADEGDEGYDTYDRAVGD